MAYYLYCFGPKTQSCRNNIWKQQPISAHNLVSFYCGTPLTFLLSVLIRTSTLQQSHLFKVFNICCGNHTEFCFLRPSGGEDFGAFIYRLKAIDGGIVNLEMITYLWYSLLCESYVHLTILGDAYWLRRNVQLLQWLSDITAARNKDHAKPIYLLIKFGKIMNIGISHSWCKSWVYLMILCTEAN